MYSNNKTQFTGFHATMEEALAALNQPFLQRQVRITPRNNEEAFNLIINSLVQAQDQPIQLIVNPGVDMFGHAYFYVILRIDRSEVEVKVSVNQAVIALMLAFMCGAKELPVVESLEPMVVDPANKIAWYQDLEKQLMEMKAVRKEKIEMTEKGAYLKVTYKFERGKVNMSRGKVENIIDLLRN